MNLVDYRNTVLGTLGPMIQQQALVCLQDGDEAAAEQVITQLRRDLYPTSTLRYRFPHETQQRNLIKAIFEFAIKNEPDRVLRAPGNSIYPRWKNVVWINAPRALSSVLENTGVKIIISVAVIFTSASAGYVAYLATADFITARALPFIINNTHIQIIRTFNAVMSQIEAVWSRPWTVLGWLIVGKVVVLRAPEIPYLTAVARAINPLGIFFLLWWSPQTIGGFLVNTSISIAKAGWNCCNEISMFLRAMAEQSEIERFAASKQQAYTLWVESLQNGR